MSGGETVSGPDTHGNDFLPEISATTDVRPTSRVELRRRHAATMRSSATSEQVRANVLGDGVGVDPARQAMTTNSPHVGRRDNEVRSMLYETELYAFDASGRR